MGVRTVTVSFVVVTVTFLLSVLAAEARPFAHLHSRVFEEALHKRIEKVPDDFHTMPKDGMGKTWFQENFEPSIRCPLDERIGNVGDGGKWVCDPSMILKPGCVLFSVGGNNQWDFEEGMHKFNCGTHTWDYTVVTPIKKPDYVNFYQIGLATTNSTNMADLRKMMELAKVDKIDVMKVDCEGCEWDWLSNDDTMEVLRTKVGQLLIEFHWRDVALMESIASRLTKAGFRAFSKEPNIQYSDGSCIEYSLVNLNLLDETKRRALVEI